MTNELRTTLGKQHTFGFFCGSDGPFPGGEDSKKELRQQLWEALQIRWATLVKENSPEVARPEIILLYQILRGKDYRKAFGLVSNENKLNNGVRPDRGLRTALCLLRLRAFKGDKFSPESLVDPFEGLIDERTIEDILKIVPNPAALPVTVNFKEAMPYSVELPKVTTLTTVRDIKRQHVYPGA
jgi:hypothetical protein